MPDRLPSTSVNSVGTSSIPRNVAAEKYREILDRRSAGELRTLAFVKRFIERYTADSRFRDQLRDSGDALQRVTEAYGIEIDPRQALPLFHPDYIQFRFSEETAERWPIAKVWDDYVTEMAECRAMCLRTGDCADASPRFHAWRQRQIRRATSELGAESAEITHPILAFELSAGCSVGCWFCGISADRFQGNFLYSDENAGLWRSILGHAVELFGTAAQTGFCYWGTDPSDNPDYPRFIEDYCISTGSLPQTTTAAPLRSLDFTREVLRLSDRYGGLVNRFSILSLKVFDAVHETFSAEELMSVELVLQNRESLTAKALAGRARERHQKQRSTGKTGSIETIEGGQSTIACVSGFLVNLVNRTIQLVTPTRSGERWPLGYRVHGERRFVTARDFRLAIEDVININMPKELGHGDVVSFRDDLIYARSPDGFELSTANGRFELGGFLGAGQLGDLIRQSDKTAGEIHVMLTRAGADFLVTADALQQLFDCGLLNEDPKLGGIGSGMLPILTGV